MKKVFLISVLILSGLSSFAVITRETQEIYTPIFISRFYKCIPCKMEQTILSEDGNLKIQRFLKNWRDHKCRYAEIRVQNDEKTEFSCTFTREQVNTLVSVMRQDPKNEGVAKTEWDKLIEDKNTCQIIE